MAARIRINIANLLSFRLGSKIWSRPFSEASHYMAANRIYTSVRSEAELATLLSISSSSGRPLITLWTASFCSTCAKVAPLVKQLVEDEGIGRKEGGLSYAQIEVDAPTSGSLGYRYAISSLPTLLAFDREDAKLSTRVTNARQLQDKEFVRQWLEREAARTNNEGGSSTGGSLFKSLWR